MKGFVKVIPYNSEWDDEYIKIREMIEDCIGDLIIAIEHIGSTSIKGLASKPIIDFIIIIDSYDVFPQVIQRLKCIGFEHEGDLGIKDREAFRRSFKDEFMPYHMYICPKTSNALHEQIAFRNYLRTHVNEAMEYGNLKLNLAKQYPDNISKYMEGKDECVKAIIKKMKKK